MVNDARAAYVANQGIRAVNAARENRNTFGNANWAMSQPKEFYLNRDNLSKVKDTLKVIPAVTTDQKENRNMYQMMMNAVKGGGGAQMIDTSGLPAGARRTGRTLFQDPAKSQGFFGDMRTMVGDLTPAKKYPNPAAVRAPEVNYFPNFGQEGKDFYKKEFPFATGLESLMNAGSRFIPGANALRAVLPKRKRKLIDRTLLPTSGIVDLLPEQDISQFADSIEESAGEGITTDRILDVVSRSPGFEYESPIDNTITEVSTQDDINNAWNYLYGKEIYEMGAPITIEQLTESYGNDKTYIDKVLRQKQAAEEMGII